MTTISTQQILKNIYAIAEKKDIMVRDVENAAGVSIGYFSKMMKQGSETKLSIDTLMGLSELFDMPVESIVNYHLREDSLKSDDMMKFIVKLREDTQKRKLNWQATREIQAKDSFIKSFGYDNLMPQVRSSYCAPLNDSDRIYFYQVDYYLNDGLRSSVYVGYELYMSYRDKVYPVILSMNNVNHSLLAMLGNLEGSIIKNAKEVQVDEHVKEVILNYMSEGKSK